MKLDEIVDAALPAGMTGSVMGAMAGWRGARIYMPRTIPRRGNMQPCSAAERFALEIREAVAEAGGTPAQADEILVGVSGGYFWV